MDIVFDEAHGQLNWAETGRNPARADTTFSGIAGAFRRAGYNVHSSGHPIQGTSLKGVKALVIPPPVGNLDTDTATWRPDPTALFRLREVQAVLDFLWHGGRVLAFSYRGGDSFTASNLREVLLPLGCLLRNDIVIDPAGSAFTHPIHTTFDTPSEDICMEWAASRVTLVQWRPTTAISILAGSNAYPLVRAPSRCIALDIVEHTTAFNVSPIAVCGEYGAGRFVVFGGPTAFTISAKGLWRVHDNERFFSNVARWLLEEQRNQNSKPKEEEKVSGKKTIYLRREYELNEKKSIINQAWRQHFSVVFYIIHHPPSDRRCY
jgi:hypothetical protein